MEKDGYDHSSSFQANTLIVPDAMNQSIYQMILSHDSSRNLSNNISSLYSPIVAAHRPILPISSSPSSSSTEFTKNTGIPRNFYYAPYFIPWKATAGPDAASIPPNFTFLTESCSGKAIIGLFGGAVAGLFMGIFLGAMSDLNPPITVIGGREIPQAPLKEQMRTTLRATAEKSLYWSRNFAYITGVFGATDCLVEKYRATHDVWNSVISGCITGAAMQAKQGPQAAALGCGGFAIFSLAIDKIMGHT